MAKFPCYMSLIFLKSIPADASSCDASVDTKFHPIKSFRALPEPSIHPHHIQGKAV
ncbi:hypothetical protein HMI56_000072 [Coelomomyces lativittatus]|nr:hypothetical protein HMI56_000072 [Coelomomyces lativittatus]